MLSEDKKKKKGPKKGDQKTPTTAFGQYASEFDFAPPLGPNNLYKGQGVANWGPYTAAVDRMSAYGLDRDTLDAVSEGTISEASAWDPFKRILERKDTTWEQAERFVSRCK